MTLGQNPTTFYRIPRFPPTNQTCLYNIRLAFLPVLAGGLDGCRNLIETSHKFIIMQDHVFQSASIDQGDAYLNENEQRKVPSRHKNRQRTLLIADLLELIVVHHLSANEPTLKVSVNGTCRLLLLGSVIVVL